jgi:hypothetical protein
MDDRAPLPHRVARARDRDGDDGRLRLESHDEPALLEGQERTGPAAGAFGKNQERIAVAKGVGGTLDRGKTLLGASALERNEPAQVKRPYEDRQLPQLRLVNDPQTRKKLVQEIEEQGRLDVARVIHRINGGTMALQVVHSVGANRDAGKEETQLHAAAPG